VRNDLVYGLHAITSLLKNRRDAIIEFYVLQGRHDKRLQSLLQRAREIPQIKKTRPELNKIADSEQHQGIIALVRADVSEMNNLVPESHLISHLEALEHPAFVLIVDGVTDPHNFGACLRSADAAGVDMVITPKDKSVGVTPVVRKVACGAAEVVHQCQITNLARTMENLQQAGIWIYGAAGEAEQSIYDFDLKGGIALVVGAEGKGMRRLTKEKCDHLFNIPMSGSVSSLNVSVATGICLFEAVRQRK